MFWHLCPFAPNYGSTEFLDDRRISMNERTFGRVAVVAALVGALVLAGCGNSSSDGAGGSGEPITLSLASLLTEPNPASQVVL